MLLRRVQFCTEQFCFMFFRYRGVQNEIVREVDPLEVQMTWG